MIALDEQAVIASAVGKPQGYLAAVLAASTRDADGLLEISEGDYAAIVRDFSSPPIGVQMLSAGRALRRFAAAGFPTCTGRQIAERAKVCKGCQWHKPSRVLLLSACGKCGCRGPKLWLATERCPVNLWPVLTASPVDEPIHQP